jgi:hypothetical protein
LKKKLNIYVIFYCRQSVSNNYSTTGKLVYVISRLFYF